MYPTAGGYGMAPAMYPGAASQTPQQGVVQTMPMAGAMPGAMAGGMQQGMAVDPTQAMYQQQNNPQAMAQMQVMYQQYALRWAAMQRFAAQAQAAQGMGMGRGQQMPGAYMPSIGSSPDPTYKTKFCNRWRETGQCPYGDKCRFAHGDSELHGGMGGMGMGGRGFMGGRGMGLGGRGVVDPQVEKRAMIDLMRKTRLCEEFMKTGVCKYGERCTFAHGDQEMRKTPELSQVQAVKMQLHTGQQSSSFPGKDVMRKTRLCERFMTTGMCNYGDNCSFAHGQHELRQPGTAPKAPASKPGSTTPTPKAIVAPAVRLLDSAGKSVDTSSPAVPSPATEQGVKRKLEDEVNEAAAKRPHQEVEPELPPSCPLCAHLVAQGKAKVLAAVQGLENVKARQVGCMIAAASPRLGELWQKCSATTVQTWISRASLSLSDKVELLKAVAFHVHAPPAAESTTGADEKAASATEGEEAGAATDAAKEGGEEKGAEGGEKGEGEKGEKEKAVVTQKAGIEGAQKYVDQGLPPAVADFVFVAMEGQEGTASMAEYFHLLEVVKALFALDDEAYYQVSNLTASICMAS